MAEEASHRFVVAGSRPWNRTTFESMLADLSGDWSFASSPEELTAAVQTGRPPRTVFFLHWSWKVELALTQQIECVVFHMTDVPFGRGGSPLQNLLERGHERTKVSAIRMSDELDAGPVYMQRELSLEGTAESIYLRADRLAAKMIEELVSHPVEPVPQAGDPVVFTRRRPPQSEIPHDLDDLDRLTDHIRMLDAAGYPHAFVDAGSLRYTFRRAGRYDGGVHADVWITVRQDDE